jgi:hypothetical protein
VTKPNEIDGWLHSLTCPLVVSGGADQCDCHPVDMSKAMCGADMLRIFKPLPPEEAAALRDMLDLTE